MEERRREEDEFSKSGFAHYIFEKPHFRFVKVNFQKNTNTKVYIKTPPTKVIILIPNHGNQ